nr:hypothetical protein CFP56_59195 [Quercus suber]
MASPRALCSSDFNTSMLAKFSLLVNLVVLTKRPTHLGAPIHTKCTLLISLAGLTKRPRCLGNLVHSKVLKNYPTLRGSQSCLICYNRN